MHHFNIAVMAATASCAVIVTVTGTVIGSVAVAVAVVSSAPVFRAER